MSILPPHSLFHIPYSVSAPGKLMLLGEHAVLHGYPCLVTAVDQRMRLKVTERADDMLEIHAPDTGIDHYRKKLSELALGDIPKGAKFVEFAVKNFHKKFPLARGVSIETASQFTSTFGFGSSSASTVCTLKALAAMVNIPLSPRDVFDLSYQTVLDIQGKGSGFDLAAAIYGGVLRFVQGGALIEPVQCPPLPLLIGYTGIKADTVSVINDVNERAKEHPDLIRRLYESIGTLIEPATVALQKGDWQALGQLMDADQRYLSQLGVSSPILDAMIAAAKISGAYGAKLSGAGKGDCMIALIPEGKRAQVGKAITHAGGQIIDANCSAEGVRLES